VSTNTDQNDVQDNSGTVRTHSVTRSGRPSRMQKDLIEDYDFNQVGDQKWCDGMIKGKYSPNSQTPSVRNTFGVPASVKGPRFESIGNNTILHHAFTQFSLRQGLRKFPVEAREATIVEIKQLHDMKVFVPVKKSSLSTQELLGVLNAITFIRQKQCGQIKARTCADGRPQRMLFEKWEASSPTVRTKSVLLTSVIDAHDKRAIYWGIRYTWCVLTHQTNRCRIYKDGWRRCRIPG
jgi:hypothetical protein